MAELIIRYIIKLNHREVTALVRFIGKHSRDSMKELGLSRDDAEMVMQLYGQIMDEVDE